MGVINVLDFHVANLIAAGEVVDRPAAVVKELLENAIDSGADSVTVEIKRGGVSFIRVSDNGCGMAREDVPIALKRHATSKIKEAEDLDSITTLGFRGEALAAISSVSELRILTKRKEDTTGTILEAAGGRITSVTDAGCPEGTSVIVENLFFNTPARLKFLKKDGTEAANVAAYVEKIALSHPEITIRFISDGEVKYSTAGDGSRKNAIYAVLGRDFAKKSLEIRGGFDGVEVTGYIGSPENVRGNRNLQIFFINNRFIRSKTVSAALEQAFTTYIPSDKFPCAVLYLQMNPAMVDVNVHPAKLEVKFSNERLIFESVYYAVRGALESSLSRPELRISADTEKKQAQRDTVNAFVPGKEGRGGEKQPTPKELRQTLEEAASHDASITDAVPQNRTPSVVQTSVPRAMPDVKAYTAQKETPAVEISHLDDLRVTVPKHIKEAFSAPVCDHSEREKETSVHDSTKESVPADVVPPDGSAVPVPPKKTVEYRMVGEVFQCYVVLESGDTMYLVDKHAAHERIIFEDLKKNGKQSEQNVQMLLMPLSVTLTASEAEAAMDFRQELTDAGFSFAQTGREVRIAGIPSFLDTGAAQDAFCEAVSRLADASGTAALTRDLRYEKALFQASCKAAIKAGREYDAAHLKWICDRVMNDPEIRYCPHGRPVCFTMTKSTIEGRFGRT